MLHKNFDAAITSTTKNMVVVCCWSSTKKQGY